MKIIMAATPSKVRSHCNILYDVFSSYDFRECFSNSAEI